MKEVKVENYSHLDVAVLVDSNGEKYAVGEDDTGHLTILTGGMNPDKQNVFWAQKKAQHVMIPTAKLKQALEKLP